jgi:hypothetical protein
VAVVPEVIESVVLSDDVDPEEVEPAAPPDEVVPLAAGSVIAVGGTASSDVR